MITKNQIKFIRGLSDKKNRRKSKCFIVEGEKCVSELLISSYNIVEIYALKDWKDTNMKSNCKINIISLKELKMISNLKSPNNVLAIASIKKLDFNNNSRITLVLDSINDPGNLGSILRTCDWFGVNKIICSESTVDIFSPKVVQSSMGSLFRVDVTYTNLINYLSKINSPIYGAYTDGEDVGVIMLNDDIHLVMGNEAHGISKKIEDYIGKKISIRNIGGNTDSLNVSIATSIILHKLCN